MLSKDEFWAALWHTIQFTLYTVPPLVILAFVFAVLVNRLPRGQWFFRLAFFVPFILPSAAIALIWLFIFTPATGLVELWCRAGSGSTLRGRCSGRRAWP